MTTLVHMPTEAELDAYLASPDRLLECDLCGEPGALFSCGDDGMLCPVCRAWDPEDMR